MLFFRIVPRNFLRLVVIIYPIYYNFLNIFCAKRQNTGVFLTFLSQKHLIVLLLFLRFLLVPILNHFAQFQSLQELYEFYSDGVCIKCNN